MARTHVGIVGAGPAGLMLAHLLGQAGVDSVVVERRDREYVESRVRAGVLEHGSAELLRQAGVGERMEREGLFHAGVNLQFEGRRHRIDFVALAGRGITVYGQQEVVKDLIAARLAAGGEVVFGAEVIAVTGVDQSDAAAITYRTSAGEHTLECDFVACCDGTHGVGQALFRRHGAEVVARSYPYGWLGILARTPPAAEELIYAYSENGFALASMRTPEISRLYLQVHAEEDLSEWPEQRIWSELRSRLGASELAAGEILESGVTTMRSAVIEPMQMGRVFLAGDAAHIVPPTGAKGMNLALADARELAAGLGEFFASGDRERLAAYTGACLRRVWRAEHFSSFMTDMLHRDFEREPFAHRLRLAQLRHIAGSESAARSLAENYTGAASGLVPG